MTSVTFGIESPFQGSGSDAPLTQGDAWVLLRSGVSGVCGLPWASLISPFGAGPLPICVAEDPSGRGAARAGDATFHHGRCPHMATPNCSNDPRVAHTVIFMSAETRYSGAGHVVTDPLHLEKGEPLAGEMFPLV